jgi:hypothetical protein
MSFNTTTGALTGTPNTVAAATNYTINATNASGSATQIFSLTVTATLAAPAFTLSASSESRTVNTTATGFTINSTGGAIASFSISATPPGMSFNTTTGALTGTPNTVAAATNYTINATNASGSATQTFTLTVSIATPAFTLSSATETKTAGSAITGYTISSTGGAIASYTISPAAPAGLTFSTSTGLLSGTPTTVAGATAYTITATNASGSATQTFTLTVTAAVYTVGQTGPGGGKVFYVATTAFSCGPTLATTCTYLEAASTTATTNPWTDATYAWSGNTTVEIGANAQGTAIGTGYKNTLAIVGQASGGDAATKAGTISRAYRGPNNLMDWYLPSKDELNQMCKWQRGITGEALTNLTTVCTGGTLNSGVGAQGFGSRYWSSSNSNSNAGFAWTQWFGDPDTGFQASDGTKSVENYVRPVRAF